MTSAAVGHRAAVLLTSALLCLVAIGCNASTEPVAVSAAWVGTIATEGNVTTVVNESGSVWGGVATLVEEASIGVDSGADEYLFGEISGLYATEDEIFVVDQHARRVRVYDFEGNHLRSFGGPGQGPGEFSSSVHGVVVGDDGRVYVLDAQSRRVNVYSAIGEPLPSLPLLGEGRCCDGPLVLADNGGVWVYASVGAADGGATRRGLRVFTADGPTADSALIPVFDFERHVGRVEGRDRPIPFSPRVEWTYTYQGAVVAGASDRYAFRIIRPSGEALRVERFWDPVPVSAGEADWWRRFQTSFWGPAESGWPIPAHKPPYRGLVAATNGDIWVIRDGPADPRECEFPAEQTQDRLPETCATHNLSFDVFDGDGRYLGEVSGIPRLVRLPFSVTGSRAFPPFVRGETVILAMQDEVGTLMVKRYRLVLPRE